MSQHCAYHSPAVVHVEDQEQAHSGKQQDGDSRKTDQLEGGGRNVMKTVCISWYFSIYGTPFYQPDLYTN